MDDVGYRIVGLEYGTDIGWYTGATRKPRSGCVATC